MFNLLCLNLINLVADKGSPENIEQQLNTGEDSADEEEIENDTAKNQKEIIRQSI